MEAAAGDGFRRDDDDDEKDCDEDDVKVGAGGDRG